MATGAGAVWLANGLLGSSLASIPASNSVVETIDDVTARHTAGSAALGHGQCGLPSGSERCVKVNPSTNEPDLIGVVGNTPSAVAVDERWVWVANAGDNTLSQVNPRTVSAVKAFTVGGRPSSVAVGAGAVWVANEDGDNVTRIDASSGSGSNIPVGTGPTGVAFGAGAVWVANAGDGTVSRIDPGTGEVVEVIPVGNRPTGVAFGEGAVWVTVQAPSLLETDRRQVEERVHDDAAGPARRREPTRCSRVSEAGAASRARRTSRSPNAR